MKKLAISMSLSGMTICAICLRLLLGLWELNITNISNSDAKMKPSIY